MHGITADLGRAGEGNRVAAEAIHVLGGIDDLFFCVGRSGRASILGTSVATLQDYLAANLYSAVELTQAVAADVTRAAGHLVYIGSLAGKLVIPWMGPYSVGKAALAAWVDAVRLEVAPRGGHVLLVSPGPIRRLPSADATVDPQPGRYADEVAGAGLPPDANRPGGGAGIKAIDPDWLAGRILTACDRRTAELVVPGRAGLLAGLVEWFPDAGRRLLGRLVRVQ
jgi:short-subunit dehydrogenase